MDLSNLGSRRKIVHVWDVFSEKGGKDKIPKPNSVTTPKKELFQEEKHGIYLADGVSHGVKSQKSPGRKKRLAPKPPDETTPNDIAASNGHGTGLKEMSNLAITPFNPSKCNNLINTSIPEYDPVTGIRMSNSDESENVSSHGFIFGKDTNDKVKDTEYPCDLHSPTESMDDPFGLTTSNASRISTRASSGYYSDGDVKDSLRKQVIKGLPSYPDIEEAEVESEINNNLKKDSDNSDSFEEDEMTMSFDEEDEEIEGRERKLYHEYAGEDFSVFIQDDANEKRKKKKSKKTKTVNKNDENPFTQSGTGDPAGSVYKGTLLGITRNFGNKSTLSSFDKLSNFSFSDSKIGSLRPDKSCDKDGKGFWWDISNMSGDKMKKDKQKGWNSAVIPENDFSVFSYDQRANKGH